MKLITERSQIKEIANRWHSQYEHNVQTNEIVNIEIKLALLDKETATTKDVTEIIGNDTWCQPSKCDECGAIVDVAVQVGKDTDYKSATAVLCISCIEKALSLIRSNT